MLLEEGRKTSGYPKLLSLTHRWVVVIDLSLVNRSFHLLLLSFNHSSCNTPNTFVPCSHINWPTAELRTFHFCSLFIPKASRIFNYMLSNVFHSTPYIPLFISRINRKIKKNKSTKNGMADMYGKRWRTIKSRINWEKNLERNRRRKERSGSKRLKELEKYID